MSSRNLLFNGKQTLCLKESLTIVLSECQFASFAKNIHKDLPLSKL